eukprot:TRINITY_DN10399_c0_g1_i1.p1 TRINITY_DN10399_c0_g1~~TRINITY_DN10399_c0_g1_i1.p1  ORF type:complete len:217 (-),score=53.30 TRINITY_DN10399_c0_g1_i1:29-625(-)
MKEFGDKEIHPDDLSFILERVFAEVDQKLIQSCEFIGSTATIVVVWQYEDKRYVQAANVGDSTSFLARGKSVISLSLDHKPNKEEERKRMVAEGIEILEDQNRVNGLSVSRAMGDHFLKTEKVGVISRPYISDCIEVTEEDSLIVLASDGLWDVMSGERSIQIAQHFEKSEPMANALMQAALAHPKCVDNVTVIVIQL